MKYLVVTIIDESPKIVQEFESEIEDLDKRPYDNDCPVVIGSNQIIIPKFSDYI